MNILKRLLQKIIPSFLLNKYKEQAFYKILRDFKVEDQLDLLVIEKLINSDSIIIDIGANIGLYTKFLSPLVREVHSFEPVPFTFDMLTKSIQKFNLENVVLNQVALSSTNGETVIDIPIQNGTRNYYRASIEKLDQESKSDLQISVPTKTIDFLFKNSSKEITFVKCDVEGHELACIQGAQVFLKNSNAAWLIEISENPDDSTTTASQLFKIMKDFQFDVFLYEDGILRKRRRGDSCINYFFLKEAHLQTLSDSDLNTNYDHQTP